MKKIKYLLAVFLLLVAPRMVNAASNVNISCSPNSVTVGGSTTCNITGNTDEEITSLEIKLSFGDNVTIGTFTPQNDWIGSDVSNGKIEIHRENAVTGEFNIGSLAVTFNSNHATGSTTLLLENIIFYKADSIEVNVNNTSTTVTVNAESEPEASGLESLSIINGALTQSFNTDTLAYNVLLDSADTATFGVIARPANSSDTVTITNEGNAISDPSNITFNASSGSMSIKIVVGSKTYTLLVKKPTVAASNELSSLVIDGVYVDLSSGKYDYTVTLSSNKNYTVNATLKDSEHFKISNLNLPTEMSGSSFAISIDPKDTSSGLTGTTYRITVKTSGSSGGGSSSGGSSSGGSGSNASGNPQTGEVAMIMAVVLFLSFGISMYLYKRNLENYN